MIQIRLVMRVRRTKKKQSLINNDEITRLSSNSAFLDPSSQFAVVKDRKSSHKRAKSGSNLLHPEKYINVEQEQKSPRSMFGDDSEEHEGSVNKPNEIKIL